MSEIAAATAAAAPVRLGGREFNARPLNFRAIGELENAAVAWYLARVRRAEEIMDAEDWKALRRDAGRVVTEIGLFTRAYRNGDGNTIDREHVESKAARAFGDFLMSPEGAVKFAHLMIRGEHKAVTIEELGELLNTPTVIFDAINQLRRVNFGDDDTDDDDDKDKPKKNV